MKAYSTFMDFCKQLEERLKKLGDFQDIEASIPDLHAVIMNMFPEESSSDEDETDEEGIQFAKSGGKGDTSQSRSCLKRFSTISSWKTTQSHADMLDQDDFEDDFLTRNDGKDQTAGNNRPVFSSDRKELTKRVMELMENCTDILLLSPESDQESDPKRLSRPLGEGKVLNLDLSVQDEEEKDSDKNDNAKTVVSSPGSEESEQSTTEPESPVGIDKERMEYNVDSPPAQDCFLFTPRRNVTRSARNPNDMLREVPRGQQQGLHAKHALHLKSSDKNEVGWKESDSDETSRSCSPQERVSLRSSADGTHLKNGSAADNAENSLAPTQSDANEDLKNRKAFLCKTFNVRDVNIQLYDALASKSRQSFTEPYRFRYEAPQRRVKRSSLRQRKGPYFRKGKFSDQDLVQDLSDENSTIFSVLANEGVPIEREKHSNVCRRPSQDRPSEVIQKRSRIRRCLPKCHLQTECTQYDEDDDVLRQDVEAVQTTSRSGHRNSALRHCSRIGDDPKHDSFKPIQRRVNKTLKAEVTNTYSLTRIQVEHRLFKSTVQSSGLLGHRAVSQVETHTQYRICHTSDSELYSRGYSRAQRSQWHHPSPNLVEYQTRTGRCRRTKSQLSSHFADPFRPTVTEWTDSDVELLNWAVTQHKPTTPLYWQKVSRLVGDRSPSACQSKFMDLKGPGRVQKRRLPSSQGRRQPKPLRENALDAGQVFHFEDVVTGGKGTLKRKRQLREYMALFDHEYEEDFTTTTPYLEGESRIKFPVDPSEVDYDTWESEESEQGSINRSQTLLHDDSRSSSSYLFSPSDHEGIVSPSFFRPCDRDEIDRYIFKLQKNRRQNGKVVRLAKPQNLGNGVTIANSRDIMQCDFNANGWDSPTRKELDSEEEQDYYFDEEDI